MADQGRFGGIAAGGVAIHRQIAFVATIAAALVCGCAQSQVPSEQDRVQQRRAEMLQRRAEALALAREAGDKIDAGKHKEAQSLLNEALDKDPYSFAARNNLGVLYLQQRRYYDAAQAFEQASKLEPAAALPYYNLGRLLEQTYRWEQAARQYELALARQPDFLPAMEQLSQCYMRLDRQPQRVKELLDRASRLEHRPEWLEWLTVQAAAAKAGDSAASAASYPPNQASGTVQQ
jgi:tetratricopeptide (TPR) repeat protein